MKYEKIIIGLITLCFLITIIQPINGLKLLSPIIKDLDIDNTANIGNVSSDEYWLISFLLEDNENYTDIYVKENQKNEVIIDSIKKTKESIYAILKINENIKGEYILTLILKSDNKQKEVNLKLYITDKVIHSVLENYNKNAKINQTHIIPITLLNKSTSTKNIIITSDLSEYWFDGDKTKKTIRYVLQPNSKKTVFYRINPQKLGEQNFNIFIQSVINNENKLFSTQEDTIIYSININIKKDLKSIYESKKHSYPLFNQNLIPLYFFNKIIKLI
jgi:hypothetical protein